MKLDLEIPRVDYILDIPNFRIYVWLSKHFQTTQAGVRVGQWFLINVSAPGVLLIWIIVGQGSTLLTVGASGPCLDIFSPLSNPFSLFALGDGPI